MVLETKWLPMVLPLILHINSLLFFSCHLSFIFHLFLSDPADPVSILLTNGM